MDVEEFKKLITFKEILEESYIITYFAIYQGDWSETVTWYYKQIDSGLRIKDGTVIPREMYKLSYETLIKDTTILMVSKDDFEGFLEDIYEMFNIKRPEDFEGHSLSVSDIIHVTLVDPNDGIEVDKYYMVCVTGFKEIEFEKEDV